MPKSEVMEQRHKFITHPNKCPSGPHQSRNLPSTCHEAIWFRIRRIWEDRGKEKRKQKMRCFFVGDAILSYTIQLYGDCFMNSCIDPYRPTRIAWKVRGCFFLCVCVCLWLTWKMHHRLEKNIWCLFGAYLGFLWMRKWMLQVRFSFSTSWVKGRSHP